MTMRRPIKAMVDLVSADLVGRGLTESGLPPLAPLLDGSAGAILYGVEHIAEQSTAPRVVFELVGASFAAADSAVLDASNKTAADTQARWAARPIATMVARFKVHCWGIYDPTPGDVQDPYADADATVELACAVIRSIVNVLPGVTVEDGARAAASSDAQGTQLVRLGNAVSFYFTTPIPILDYSVTPIGAGVKPTVDLSAITPNT